MAISPISLIRGIKYTAVDFGHHSIKAINCRVKNGELKLLGSAYREFPPGTISGGRLEDIHLMEKLLAEIFEEDGMKPGVIIFTPASGEEFLRKVELPAMPKQELKEALNWEVQEYINVPPERVAVDYITLEESDDGLILLLTVLPKEVLNDYLEVFKRNSLDAKVANLEEMAMISLMSYQNKLDEPALFVNIGDSQTKILIASKNDYFLSRTIEVAGYNFTSVFLEEEDNREEAENAKKRFEFIPDEADDEEIDMDLIMSGVELNDNNQNRIKNLLDQVVNQVDKSIDYFRERYSEVPLNNLYLTGGGSKLNGLDLYFNSKLDININKIKCFEGIDTSNISTTGQSLMLAVAAGTVASEVIHNES